MPPWRHEFLPVGPRSAKVRCRRCGRKGYDGTLIPNRWQVSCLRGHTYRCGDCGALLQNLDAHWNCRLDHWLCPTHLDTQYRQLQRSREIR